MEKNEIMGTEEVMDVTEEVATKGPSKGLKVAAGIGIAVLVAGLSYKFVIKPIAAKIKANKTRKRTDQEIELAEGDYEVIED